MIAIAFIGAMAWLPPTLVGAQGPEIAAADAGPYYTVQILSVPAVRSDRVLRAYDDLKARGHLVYCRHAYVHERAYTRLRAGFFRDRHAAEACAETLRDKEGLHGFVTQADLAVASFGEAFDIVTTPNDLWLLSQGSLRPLYHFDSIEAAATCSTIAIGPDGRTIAFACDNRILRIDLDRDTTTTLAKGQSEDALFRCTLAWSPDGRHIAYLDRVGWELPTRLWIMRSDGDANHCLAGDDTGRTRVKSFRWHPSRLELFYVSGPTHGTVSVGGSLYRVNLQGRRDLLVPACLAERTEVCRQFRIAGDQIHYRIAHFDPDYQEITYTTQTAPLDP